MHKRPEEGGNLDQVGGVGVLLRSDKVLLDGSGGNESVEDVDGTGLTCQLSHEVSERLSLPCRWFLILGHHRMAADRQRLLYIYR